MKLLSLTFMGVFLTFAQCNSPKTAESRSKPETEMSLKQQVENGAMIVDVRTPEEFESGHYPGSVNIPLDEVSSRIEEFKNKPSVVVYCRSGNRSSQAMNILKENGINNVTNGINEENLKKELQ